MKRLRCRSWSQRNRSTVGKAGSDLVTAVIHFVTRVPDYFLPRDISFLQLHEHLLPQVSVQNIFLRFGAPIIFLPIFYPKCRTLDHILRVSMYFYYNFFTLSL